METRSLWCMSSLAISAQQYISDPSLDVLCTRLKRKENTYSTLFLGSFSGSYMEISTAKAETTTRRRLQHTF